MMTSREPEVMDEVVAAAFCMARVLECLEVLGMVCYLQGVIIIQVAFDNVNIGCFPCGNSGFGFGYIAYKTDDGVGRVAGEVA
jgi:hypothetical protein